MPLSVSIPDGGCGCGMVVVYFCNNEHCYSRFDEVVSRPSLIVGFGIRYHNRTLQQHVNKDKPCPPVTFLCFVQTNNNK